MSVQLHSETNLKPGTVPVILRVNGVPHTLQIDPRVTLLDAIREYLGLNGTKRAATAASVGPAPSWLTGGESTPASPSQSCNRGKRS